MTKDIAQQAIDKLFAMSGKLETVDIVFFGGEPLLNKPVLHFIIDYSQQQAEFHKKKVTYRMTTNGTLLDDEMADLIEKYKIAVMVSLDGQRETHDAQCPTHDGRGSYDKAVNGIKKLLKRHCHTEVRCTMIHPAPDLKGLLEFYDQFDERGFTRIVIEPALNPVNNPSPVDFTKDDFAELIRQEEEMLPWIIEKLKFKETPKYFPYIGILREMNAGAFSPSVRVCNCAVCTSIVSVGADGTIFPCARFGGMKEWQIGHVTQDFNHEQSKKFWRDFRKNIAPHCGSCWAFPACKGPCAWDIMQSDGTFLNPRRECERRKAQIQNAAYILNSHEL